MMRSLYQIHDEPEAWWAHQTMTDCDDSATIQKSLLMWPHGLCLLWETGKVNKHGLDFSVPILSQCACAAIRIR